MLIQPRTPPVRTRGKIALKTALFAPIRSIERR